VSRSNSNNKNDKENNLINNSLDKDENKGDENEKDNSINSLDLNKNFNVEDFQFIKQIGEGTFGKIYSTKWNKNNKEYAMKKMFLKTKAEIKRNKEQSDLVYNFLKKTGNNGVVKIYGSQYKETEDDQDKDNNDDKNNGYTFYVLMELAQIDWEKEINKRKISKNYYTEGEIYKIMRQLIKSFSELQKNYITHRDIKPQNILVVNCIYKIGDFGEAKITEGNSIIKQSIKGTELYMSPILFTALNKRQNIIIHNTFKSDVFSLGMCLFLAATLTFRSLYEIREVKDSKVIKKILEKYLIVKYSYNFVNILVKMLEVDENLRPDFIELEKDFFYK
jgi:serine/threonine protein kinase